MEKRKRIRQIGRSSVPSRVPLSTVAMRGTGHPCAQGPQSVIDPGLDEWLKTMLVELYHS